MRVVIAGGHGQIARRLSRLLATAAAEDDRRARDRLRWTILRPGGLTDARER